MAKKYLKENLDTQYGKGSLHERALLGIIEDYIIDSGKSYNGMWFKFKNGFYLEWQVSQETTSNQGYVFRNLSNPVISPEYSLVMVQANGYSDRFTKAGGYMTTSSNKLVNLYFDRNSAVVPFKWIVLGRWK